MDVFEFINTAFSAVALAVSIGTAVYTIISNRGKLDVYVRSCYIEEDSKKQFDTYLAFALSFQNYSHSSAFITDLILNIGTRKFKFRWLPKIIKSETLSSENKGVIRKEEWSAKVIPFTMSPRSEYSGYFIVDIDRNITFDNLKLSKNYIEVVTGKKHERIYIDFSVLSIRYPE
jgi:hypothetical protein